MAHLFVSRLWFEGNRFSRQPTDAAAFARREDRHGPAALDGLANTATELAAVIDFIAARPHWQLTVSRCASAEPGGPIAADWLQRFVADTCADLLNAQPSHIYLSLHGAAIAANSDTPELDWLRAIRRLAPATPIAVSFDLHGNLDPAIVELIDFGTAYRCHPHTDMRETAARALARLASAPAVDPPPAPRPGQPRTGLACIGSVVKLGRLLPSFNMLTANGPMAELEALARNAERHDSLVEVSVFGGFPYADTPVADAAVMVWAEPNAGAAGEAVARSLIEAMRERLPRFEPMLPNAATGLETAAQTLAQSAGLVAVTDPGDNPLSGGEGQSTTLLRALLKARTTQDTLAGLPADAVVFAAMTDPELAAAAHRAGCGARLDIVLGRTTPPAFGGPLPATATVVGLSEGRFINTGPMETGRPVAVGPSAVLACGGVHIIVTSSVCPANDPACFAAHGIDLDRVRLLCVKAKNHFRAAFAARCLAIIDVDCPGPAAAQLSLLPLRHWTGQGEPLARHD